METQSFPTSSSTHPSPWNHPQVGHSQGERLIAVLPLALATLSFLPVPLLAALLPTAPHLVERRLLLLHLVVALSPAILPLALLQIVALVLHPLTRLTPALVPVLLLVMHLAPRLRPPPILLGLVSLTWNLTSSLAYQVRSRFRTVGLYQL